MSHWEQRFWCIWKGGQNWISKGELFCKLFFTGNTNSCQECRRDAEVTYLLMYSPVRTFPQALHLKHPRCHCLSRASNACPFFMSLPQPAQSVNKQTNAFIVSYLVSLILINHPPIATLGSNQMRESHTSDSSWVLYADSVFVIIDILSRRRKAPLLVFMLFMIQRLPGKLCTNFRFC